MKKTIQIIIFLIFIIELVPAFRITQIKSGAKSISPENSIIDTRKRAIKTFLESSGTNLQPIRKHYHFKIFHKYHNKDEVPIEVNVLPRDITLCDDRSGEFCPKGSTAMCTKNGAIRCLTKLWDTILCDNAIFSHCASIDLPCNKYTPECRLSNSSYFTVYLPCISMINVYANLMYVNKTIIAQDLIKIYPPNYFCETILALPAELTEGEELYYKSSLVFGQFAVKAFGVVK